jgi:hypothetical protein
MVLNFTHADDFPRKGTTKSTLLGSSVRVAFPMGAAADENIKTAPAAGRSGMKCRLMSAELGRSALRPARLFLGLFIPGATNLLQTQRKPAVTGCGGGISA